MVKRYTQKPTIKLSKETMNELDRMKLVRSETYEDTIIRMIKFYNDNWYYGGFL